MSQNPMACPKCGAARSTKMVDNEDGTETKMLLSQTYDCGSFGTTKDKYSFIERYDCILRQRNQLIEAMKFYANAENWKEIETGIGMTPSEADVDSGEIARMSLLRM